MSSRVEDRDGRQRLALEHAERTRRALARFEATNRAADFNEAFGCARASVLALQAGADPQALDVEHARRLMAALPGVAALAQVAAQRASTTVGQHMHGLWDQLEFTSQAPGWSDAELTLAAELIVLSLAQSEHRPPEHLAATLRRLGTHRLAAAIVDALAASGEGPWQRALGERYDSVTLRYAPRTPGGHRGLAVLMGDEQVRATVLRKLTEWLGAGAEPTQLAGALEAAICHTRTPARVAL